MYSLRRYDWTIHIATILFCSFFMARGVTTYLAGALEAISAAPVEVKPVKADEGVGDEDKSSGPDAYKSILDRNIFNSADSGVAKEETDEQATPEQLGELGPAVKTSLDIKVLSTLMVGAGTDMRSSAVVSGGGKSKTPEAYFAGDADSFAPNVKMTTVMKDRIEFINGGRLEYAELQDITAKKTVFASAEEAFAKPKDDKAKDKDKDKDAAPADGGKFTIDQKDVDEALQNLDKLYSDVRIVPNYKDGKPAGMKVLSIKPGSLVSKLGVRRGDVLQKVNGQELDIKSGMQLFGSMKDSKNFSLEVERGGKNQTLEYEIK